MMPQLLRVENLSKSFPVNGGFFHKEIKSIKAVQNVSFSISKGETLGLVGESGSGKSTLGRCLLRLIEPSNGKVFFQDQEITQLKKTELREIRKKIQIIFQDPYASLNPRMTISAILEEPLLIHGLGKDYHDRRQRIEELAHLVGLNPEQFSRFPHEFSGGQRQRIGIARALAVKPELIICDEPVSSLDMSIQAQIINLLMDLQKQLGLTYIFIAHDLNLVKHVSQSVAVMYLGKIVEMAPVNELYFNPQHPYTKALLASIPIPDPARRSKKRILWGDPPSVLSPPRGCSFYSRCSIAQENCQSVTPMLVNTSSDHQVACLMCRKGTV